MFYFCPLEDKESDESFFEFLAPSMGTFVQVKFIPICFWIRTERGNCRICWTTVADIDFRLSSSKAANHASKMNCCGYGEDGKKKSGFDCLVIPGALTGNKMMTLEGAPMICGRSRGLGSFSTGPKTICSKYKVRSFSNQNQLQ